MDLESPIEITIGPYEVYEDKLFGYKAAFESFVTVADPEESAKLARYMKFRNVLVSGSNRDRPCSVLIQRSP